VKEDTKEILIDLIEREIALNKKIFEGQMVPEEVELYMKKLVEALGEVRKIVTYPTTTTSSTRLKLVTKKKRNDGVFMVLESYRV